MEDDTNIVNLLTKAREFLGEELTDVASELMTTKVKNDNFSKKIERSRELISEFASLISVLIINDKFGRNLDNDQKSKYQKISKFAKNLGNTQFKLNKIKKLYLGEDHQEEMNLLAFSLGEDIVKLQEEARNVNKILKELGYKIPPSDLSTLFDLN